MTTENQSRTEAASTAAADVLPSLGQQEPNKQTAIVKVQPKVGSALPTFSAPPIDAVVLGNLADKDLIPVAKHACSIHKPAGAYAKDFLAELKRRFDEGKKLGKPYLRYKNFDKLCADRLEIGARRRGVVLLARVRGTNRPASAVLRRRACVGAGRRRPIKV